MFNKLSYKKIEDNDIKIIYEKIIYYPDNPNTEHIRIMFNKKWKQVFCTYYDVFEDIAHGAILEYEEIKAIAKQIKELEND